MTGTLPIIGAYPSEGKGGCHKERRWCYYCRYWTQAAQGSINSARRCNHPSSWGKTFGFSNCEEWEHVKWVGIEITGEQNEETDTKTAPAKEKREGTENKVI